MFTSVIWLKKGHDKAFLKLLLILFSTSFYHIGKGPVIKPIR